MNPHPFKTNSKSSHPSNKKEQKYYKDQSIQHELTERSKQLSTIKSEEGFIKEAEELFDIVSSTPSLTLRDKMYFLKDIMHGVITDEKNISRTHLTVDRLAEQTTHLAHTILKQFPSDISDAQKYNLGTTAFKNFMITLIKLIEKKLIGHIEIENTQKLEKLILSINDSRIKYKNYNEVTPLHGVRLLAVIIREEVSSGFKLQLHTLQELEAILSDFSHPNTDYQHIPDVCETLGIMAFNINDYQFSTQSANRLLKMFEANLQKKLTPSQFMDFIFAFGGLAYQELNLGTPLFKFDNKIQKQIVERLSNVLQEGWRVGSLANVFSAIQYLLVRKKIDHHAAQIFDIVQKLFLLSLTTEIAKTKKYIPRVLWKFRELVESNIKLAPTFNAKVFFNKLLPYIATNENDTPALLRYCREIYLFMLNRLFKPEHLDGNSQNALQTIIAKCASIKQATEDEIAYLLSFIKELIVKNYSVLNPTLVENINKILAIASQYNSNDIYNSVQSIETLLKNSGIESRTKEISAPPKLSNSWAQGAPKPVGQQGSNENNVAVPMLTFDSEIQFVAAAQQLANIIDEDQFINSVMMLCKHLKNHPEFNFEKLINFTRPLIHGFIPENNNPVKRTNKSKEKLHSVLGDLFDIIMAEMKLRMSQGFDIHSYKRMTYCFSYLFENGYIQKISKTSAETLEQFFWEIPSNEETQKFVTIQMLISIVKLNIASQFLPHNKTLQKLDEIIFTVVSPKQQRTDLYLNIISNCINKLIYNFQFSLQPNTALQTFKFLILNIKTAEAKRNAKSIITCLGLLLSQLDPKLLSNFKIYKENVDFIIKGFQEEFRHPSDVNDFHLVIESFRCFHNFQLPFLGNTSFLISELSKSISSLLTQKPVKLSDNLAPILSEIRVFLPQVKEKALFNMLDITDKLVVYLNPKSISLQSIFSCYREIAGLIAFDLINQSTIRPQAIDSLIQQINSFASQDKLLPQHAADALVLIDALFTYNLVQNKNVLLEAMHHFINISLLDVVVMEQTKPCIEHLLSLLPSSVEEKVTTANEIVVTEKLMQGLQLNSTFNKEKRRNDPKLSDEAEVKIAESEPAPSEYSAQL